MANIRVNSIKSESGSQGPIFDANVEFTGISHIVLPKGTTAERPSNPVLGSLRFNTTTKLIEQYNGTSWISFASESSTSNRAVFGGGYNGYPRTYWYPYASLNWFYIQSSGPITEEVYFGQLTLPRSFNGGACSSSTRGVYGGGHNPEVTPSQSFSNVIDYITIASASDALDFGDLTQGRYGVGACSSSTRGVFACGYSGGSSNVVDYITIASASNALSFGNLATERYHPMSGSCSSSTRGIFAGGNKQGTWQNIIDYVTIASTGSQTDFGDLTISSGAGGSCSSDVRGIFMGGLTPNFWPYKSNIISYITIASTGDALDFGDLISRAKEGLCAASSKIRGVVMGSYYDNQGMYYQLPASDYGYNADYKGNVTSRTVEYITIANKGDALDFGSLTQSHGYGMVCSNNHGGL